MRKYVTMGPQGSGEGNLIYHRPARPETCDVCGGSREPRSDDTPQAIQARLDAYEAQTGPILQLFRKKDLVVAVDGTGTPDDVHREIRQKLGLTLAQVVPSRPAAAPARKPRGGCPSPADSRGRGR